MFQVIPVSTISPRRPDPGCPRLWTTFWGTTWRSHTLFTSRSCAASITWFASGWRPRVSAPPAGPESEHTAWTRSSTARWRNPSFPRRTDPKARKASSLALMLLREGVAPALQRSLSYGTTPPQNQAPGRARLRQTPPRAGRPPGRGPPTRQTGPQETSLTNSWKVRQAVSFPVLHAKKEHRWR